MHATHGLASATLVAALALHAPRQSRSMSGPSQPEPPAAALAIAVPPAPVARRDDVVDDYFGTKVPDPYRWLEDRKSPETEVWLQAQEARTKAVLAQVPGREAIERRVAS